MQNKVVECTYKNIAVLLFSLVVMMFEKSVKFEGAIIGACSTPLEVQRNGGQQVVSLLWGSMLLLGCSLHFGSVSS